MSAIESVAEPAVSAAPFDAHRGRHWLVRVGSPLGISLLLHAGMLGLFAGFTWVATQRVDESVNDVEATIVAEGPSGPVGGFQFPGNASIDRPDAEPQKSEKSEGLASLLDQQTKLEAPMAASLGGSSDGIGTGTLSRDDVIGTGGSGGAAGLAGLGIGVGDRDAAGGGPVGGLWGVGKGLRAKTVVYVVDRSGSFVEWMEAIDIELKRSLGILRDDQQFNLIFLRDDKPQTFKPRLVKADETAKREAFAWINQNPPAGGSDLTPAVKVALSFSPQVMFVVTDQEFLNNANGSTNMRDMLAQIHAARRKTKTAINVILMGPFERPAGDAAELRRRLNDSREQILPEEASRLREQVALLEAIEAMQKLPQETGGSFNYLNGDALMDQWRKSRTP